MCNLETLPRIRCVAVLQNVETKERKRLNGKFRSLAELWEYARNHGFTVIKYMVAENSGTHMVAE